VRIGYYIYLQANVQYYYTYDWLRGTYIVDSPRAVGIVCTLSTTSNECSLGLMHLWLVIR